MRSGCDISNPCIKESAEKVLLECYKLTAFCSHRQTGPAAVLHSAVIVQNIFAAGVLQFAVIDECTYAAGKCLA